MTIYNLGAISKDRATEAQLLKKKEYLNSLTLRLRCSEHNETEVLDALQPPTNIKSVQIEGYPGEYLPSWFRGCDGSEVKDGYRWLNIRIIWIRTRLKH